MKKILTIIITFIIGFDFSHCQTLTYQAFIDSVVANNQGYRAEQLNVPISEAQLKASRSIQNPSLSVEYGNNSDWGIQMGQSLDIGITQPVTFGVVAARKKVAKNEMAIASSNLDDYLLNLKAEATESFIDALQARELSDIAGQTFENMHRLATGDSLRFVKGDISELDMLQTRIEAKMAQQEYLDAQSAYHNALVTLDLYAGQPHHGSKAINGHLSNPNIDYTLEELTNIALQYRPDLQSAHRSVSLAESQAKLTRRERIPEAELSLGISLNSKVRNEEAPAPEFIGYTAGLSVPLPFSNANKGNIRTSQLTVQQSQLQADALEKQILSEIIQAYNNYQIAKHNANTYSNELVSDAETILKGRLYAYQRGETSLIEVLSAQETYNQVRKSHTEALHQCMTAWVELQKATGRLEIVIKD